MAKMTQAKAFNQGYNLAKLNRKKAKELSSQVSEKSPELMRIFKAGVKQQELEQARAKFNEKDMSQNIDKERTL